MRRGAALLLLALAVTACGPLGQQVDPPALAAALDAPLPDRLSDLGVLRRDADTLAPAAGIAYGLAHPLFSDYARKYRTLHLPPGGVARAAASDATTLAFPVGTWITKTFYYPLRAGRVVLAAAPAFAGPEAPLATGGMRLLETRVLRHRETGWEAVSYVWDEDGREAFKARAGALFTLAPEAGDPFDYLVPDANQCAGCHATDHGSGALAPIGPKPGNLAGVRLGSEDQYAHWRARGLVQGPAAQAWPELGPGAVRAYLDVNCAHCHSDVGAADTAGLHLGYEAPRDALGLCKSPVAAGRGSGGRAYDIRPGAPDASILLYRMDHRDPGVMMPELGRSLVHREGVAAVRAWISDLEGDCDAGRVL
ncbi:MAG: hypothetical protein V2J24_23785 [Pseudomonadales bacterium]|jgi:uncharacterized repeat protein (TIGR03806 family)|nr:hypothetical protein [Pseudomonadales bacterium]